MSAEETENRCRIPKSSLHPILHALCRVKDIPSSSSSPEVEQQSGTQPCKVSNTHNSFVACITVVRLREQTQWVKDEEEVREVKIIPEQRDTCERGVLFGIRMS